MQNADDIIGSIASQIKESQLKLGFADETITLYYLAPSLALLCGYEPTAADADELAQLLATEPKLRDTPLGPLVFNAVSGNRVSVTIPRAGVRWVHEQLPSPPFLVAIIDLFASHAHCTREDVERLFARFGSYRMRTMPTDAGFDYVARFDDPQVDPHFYCFKDEVGHTIYHRFSAGDFHLRWPDARI